MKNLKKMPAWLKRFPTPDIDAIFNYFDIIHAFFDF